MLDEPESEVFMNMWGISAIKRNLDGENLLVTSNTSITESTRVAEEAGLNSKKHF